MVQSIFTILLAICAGIYHEWKLGLVSSLFVPFVLVGSVFQAKIMSSQDNVEREAFAKSAKVRNQLSGDVIGDGFSATRCLEGKSAQIFAIKHKITRPKKRQH